MPRSYRHIKGYDKELNELRKKGLTKKKIGKKLGFSYIQVHNFFYRQRITQRKFDEGMALRKKGRPPKDYVVTEKDKVAELRYILARKETKIKSLEMENELMQDFLFFSSFPF